jgi:hypothetical protein
MHGRPGFVKTTPGRPSCRCATRPFFKRPGYPVFLRLESDLVRNERTLSAVAKAMADKHSGEVPRSWELWGGLGERDTFWLPLCGLPPRQQVVWATRMKNEEKNRLPRRLWLLLMTRWGGR